MSDDVGTPSVSLGLQEDLEVGRREMGEGFLRPFHQAHATSGEVFVEPRVEVFVRRVEAIKIKVI